MLYKLKKVENPHCPFCTNVDQTVSHLFVLGPCASSFWLEFIKWYQSISKKTLDLSKNEVIYGVLLMIGLLVQPYITLLSSVSTFFIVKH